MSTSTAAEAKTGEVDATWRLLKYTYGLVPIVVGLDKFTNLVVDWSMYLPALVTDSVPVAGDTLMFVVGIVEIVAGVAVLTRWTRTGAYVVAAWLVLVALNLVLAGYYDVAVRDVGLAIGALALAQLTAS